MTSTQHHLISPRSAYAKPQGQTASFPLYLIGVVLKRGLFSEGGTLSSFRLAPGTLILWWTLQGLLAIVCWELVGVSTEKETFA
jgi:hypothetical protein